MSSDFCSASVGLRNRNVIPFSIRGDAPVMSGFPPLISSAGVIVVEAK